MKGCLKRLGCLVLIICIVAVWYWYARVEKPAAAINPATGTPTTAASVNSGWQPLTSADAQRGQAAVLSLGRQSGPVFANLTPSEAASYIFLVLAKQLPPSAKNAEAAVIGDRLYVRADVELKDFGGSKQLGPLGMLLGDRDSVRLGGTINMLKPGLAEFLVQELKIGRIDMPSGLIPKLVTRIKRGKPVEGVSQKGLPMVMPAYISDVRISSGKITLYKSVK